MNKTMQELRAMERADLLELRGEANERVNELRNKTDLTESEIAESKETRNSLEKIALVLEERNAQKIEGVKVVGGNKTEEIGLLDVLRNLADGNSTADMRSLNEAGRAEMATAGVSTAGGFVLPAFRSNELVAGSAPGSSLVEKTTAGILTETAKVMSFTKLGATVTTGLKGNLEYITSGGVASEWKGEIEAKDPSALTFASKEFAPKRLATRVDVSVQLLKQSSLDIEAQIAQLFRNSIAKKLEETILGTSDITNAPKALFTSKNIGSNTGAASMETILKKFVNTLAAADNYSGKLGYITSHLGLATLAGTPIGGNIQGNIVNYMAPSILGAPVAASTSLSTISGAEPFILADWSKFFIGLWGGLEITRDPYTRAHEGVVRFVLNSYWDAGFIDDKARVIGTLSAPAAPTPSTGA